MKSYQSRHAVLPQGSNMSAVKSCLVSPASEITCQCMQAPQEKVALVNFDNHRALR